MSRTRFFPTQVILVVLLLTGQARSYSERRTPLVMLTCEAPFSSEHGWNLTVNEDGSAKLIIHSYPKPVTRMFTVPTSAISAFKADLEEQSFFDLSAEYGERVPDGGTRSLKVHVGKHDKTVKLLHLTPTARNLLEAKRVLRVWIVVRGWFNDPGAADTREYDRLILNTPDMRGEKR